MLWARMVKGRGFGGGSDESSSAVFPSSLPGRSPEARAHDSRAETKKSTVSALLRAVKAGRPDRPWGRCGAWY